MQELLEWLKFYENEPIRPIILKSKIKSLLEKEKEDIVTSWNDSKVSMMSGEQYFEETFNNMQNKIQSKSELLIAAEPLIKYLNENHHPHTMIIVEHTKVELYEGQQVENTNEFLID